MYLFLKKVCFFTFLLSVILFLIKLSVPYYWGNERLAGKMEYYIDNSERYNTIAIGSSLMNRSFIPEIFDNETEIETKSFNLSMGATYFYETYYLLESFTKNNDIRNILFLVQRPKEIANINLGSIRSKYFFDLKRILLSVRFYKKNLQQLSYHIQSYIENKLNIGELGAIFSYYTFLDKFEIQLDGFYDFKVTAEGVNKKQKKRVRKKLGTGEIQGINKRTKPKPIDELSESDMLFYNTLKNINRDLEEKGITCYFVYLPNDRPPKMMESCRNIYMGDGVDFPEYFYEKNRMDKAHLNIHGARIFSKRLGQLLNKELTK